MARPKLSEMTLREKIGQTAMPGPGVVKSGVQRCGGYDKYFSEYPFNGLYADKSIVDKDGNSFASPKALSETFAAASSSLKIPLFISCDLEFGANGIFKELHGISTNLSVGAAKDKKLAEERSYMWARELKTFGVNWPFGPVGDMTSSFFSSNTTRCIASSDYAEVVADLYPHMIAGIQKAGMAATAKHFPGGYGGYRDGHFAATGGAKSLAKYDKEGFLKMWNEKYKPIWKAAVDAGVLSFMTAHGAEPAFDDSITRGTNIRPGSASSKVIDLLRKDLGFNGVIVTDAVSMRSLSSSFEYEDVYIECFNAGNDVILFVRDDYFEIMEKAVLDGRISMERLDASVERILDMKEKLGLFDGEVKADAPLTEEERNKFDEVNYTVSKKALTLIRNASGTIPFNPEKVKSVGIIRLAPHESFIPDLQAMVDEFEKRGINVEVIRNVRDKDVLRRLCDDHDILIYAAFLMPWKPAGMPFFAAGEDLSTLYHGLSIGAEKSVVASFGHPSIYYNYFENADMYINAYSSDAGTMRAFVDGILGEFEFTGKSPVALKPEFKF